MELSSLTIGGRTVRFADAGDPASSRVLVLLHAFPMGAAMWQPQLDAFIGWRTIAPALPGFDGSDRWPEASMDAYAAQVLGLLDALGVDRAVIGGLSMGGYAAFALLRKAADRASALVLADTRSTADTPELRAARAKMLGMLAERGPDAVAEEMRQNLFGPSTHRERPAVIEAVRRMITAQDANAIADAINAMLGRPDSGTLLESLRVPALVLVGEDDVMTSPSAAEQMHAAIRGSTLVRVPDAGHMSNLENPDAFNEAMREFLDRI